MMTEAAALHPTASSPASQMSVGACLSALGTRWPDVPRPQRRPYVPERFAANEEPGLADLLGDPIIARLMASDGVRPDALCAVLDDARARLANR